MKRLVCLALLLSLLLAGCSQPTVEQKRYTATFLDVFDTVTTIVGLAESKEVFSQTTQAIHDELLRYHQLFDIYHEYEGIQNLCTVNMRAAQEAVEVDPVVMELLIDCKNYYTLTDGRVNVAMGSVLYLWHEARDRGINDPANAALPATEKLLEAAAHRNMEDVVLDEETSTVWFNDPQLRLDVGAVAKGWSVQKVAENAPEGLLISVGGNVCATGPKDKSGTPWVVGIQHPDGGEKYLHSIYVSGGSVVTSGDYQRAYVVDGEVYHHIIDPDTLYPSQLWRSVTVVCPDSGLADALSTALFLLSLAQGQALLEKCGAEALWMDREGQMFYSAGFEELIRM